MTDKLTHDHLYLMFDSPGSLDEFISELEMVLMDAVTSVESDEIDGWLDNGGWLKVKVPTASSRAWAWGSSDAPISAPLVGVTYEEVATDWAGAAK